MSLASVIDTAVVRVVWFRSLRTFRRQWRGYATVALLIGVVGGLAMGALLMGRRTQSAFDAFYRNTNPSDLYLSNFGAGTSGFEGPSATVPALLAVGLVVAAVIAFGLALVAAVRQRRSDLAVLKTLGLTRRRLGYTIASQATATAIVGLALGIPAGALLGDSLWTLFARSIYAVPRPTVPLVSVFLVIVITLALANLAAAIPARIAARTPAADLLRAE